MFVIGRVLRLRRNKHWQENASLQFHGFFMAPQLEGCLTGLTSALLPELEQVVPIYNLSVAVWPKSLEVAVVVLKLSG